MLHVLDNLESCEDILADVLQASHGNRLPQRVRHKKATALQEAAKEPRTQAKSVRRKKDSTSKKATKAKKTTRSVKS